MSQLAPALSLELPAQRAFEPTPCCRRRPTVPNGGGWRYVGRQQRTPIAAADDEYPRATPTSCSLGWLARVRAVLRKHWDTRRAHLQTVISLGQQIELRPRRPIAQWVVRENGTDDKGEKNSGPWEYTAIATGETAKDKTGKPAKNGKDEEAKGYNVSVCYNPEGIKWT